MENSFAPSCLFIFNMSQQGYEKKHKWICWKCCNIEENLVSCRWKERKISSMCVRGEWGGGEIACLQAIIFIILLLWCRTVLHMNVMA